MASEDTGSNREHTYRLQLEWTGNQGSGTSHYRAYSRNHVVRAERRPDLLGSAEPVFRGDPTRWTPEELLVAAVAECHLLEYLHLCVKAGVVVLEYRDDPIGVMHEDATGGGSFESVTLRPTVLVRTSAMVDTAEFLHGEVGATCFIARSVNFPIHHQPRITAEE